MSPERLEQVVAEFQEAHVARNDYLLREEEVNDRYLIVGSGTLRAFTHDVRGDEVTTAFYGPGRIVFEVASFFQRIPSKENIVALTDVQGWELSYDRLNKLFHAFPEFRDFGRRVLVMGFTALKERTLGMIHDTAEERYARLLKMDPGLFQVAPLKHIASYLGVTDTSLSRIRKDFATRS
ncbi:MAG: Crp/Fnr family transcriptional regulator [Flavobacteriales bacterium]